MPTEFLVSALVTLLVIVDPVGLAPVFAGLTRDLPAAARRGVALRASVIATLILAGTALAGNWLLARLGIGLAAFRIAGGLLLFSIASEMVFGVRINRQSRAAEQAVEERARDLAAFPLGIPLMAGPGAITATLLLAGRANFDPVLLGALIGVIVAVMSVTLVFFLVAPRVTALLGHTGNIVVERLLGVILAALAVQFVIDGAKVAFGG